MKQQQSGFTLIELIAVIVILGILAATAVPKFVDLSDAAEEAKLEGVAGALASAAALNHANNVAQDAGLSTNTSVVAITNCTDLSSLVDGVDFGTAQGEFTLTSAALTDKTASDCTLTLESGTTDPDTTFTAYGASTSIP